MYRLQHNKTLWILYSILFFFSFHGYFLLYVQSSFITQFIPEAQLSLVYGTAALISIIAFLILPKILRKYIDSTVTTYLLIAEALLCIAIAYIPIPSVILLSFILQQAILPIILFTIDVLIENNSTDAETGHIRSRAFTAANIALITSPILVGIAIDYFGYAGIYPISLLFLIPLFFLIRKIKRLDTKPIQHSIGLFHIFKTILSEKQKNVRLILLINLFLNIFYTWMVIYSPLYLQQQGFSWDQIGIMFSIMLIPFLIFPLPLGSIADSKFGHKKLLIFGISTIAITTIIFGFLHGSNIIAWTLVLFMTRVGASFVELLSDSYFFKHISNRDIYTMAFFRLNRPSSQLIAPLLASIAITTVGHASSYILLGALVLYSVIYALRITE